jgi:hypothetical protein
MGTWRVNEPALRLADPDTEIDPGTEDGLQLSTTG